MRKEDKMDSFDLEVRRLLENAEEKVPLRAWEVVSSRLDTECVAGSQSSRRWVWAAASFAVAASLAIMLIIPGGRNEVPSSFVAQSSLQTEKDLQPDSFSVPDTAASLPSSSGDVISYRHNHRTLPLEDDLPVNTFAGNAVCDDFSDGTVSEEKSVDDDVVEEGIVEEGIVEKAPQDVDQSLLAYGGWGDENDWKDDRDGFLHKISVGVEGTLNVNDSRLVSGMDVRAHMTSGSASHTKTSIEEESVSAYDIPLTFGLSIRYQFAPALSIGSGVNYSFIGRTFSGTCYEFEGETQIREISGDIRHNMQYIGIPMNLYFDFVRAKSVSCYVYGGGTAEFCVLNKYSIEDFTFKDPVNGPQFSVGAGVGVQFRVSNHLGIYLDPGVRYYFRCEQPKSIRTDQPFMVNFEAGLRFNL